MHINHGSRLAANVPRDLRRYPRVLYTARITLHSLVAGGTHSFHGISLDISQGGVGALVSGGPAIGETVQIELPLRDGVLRTGATVRHKSGARSGYEFLRLGREERMKISEITARA